ncbi:MAG: sarcosine oxidase subunit gamma family protein [Pseudomonadota bacterium]
MADLDLIIERAHPLAARVHASSGVAITPAPACYRVNLRCGVKEAGPVTKALGVDLPRVPNTSSMKGSRTVLWLGPDEWLLLDGSEDPMVALRDVDVAHSAVDISHRNTAILVSGARSADVINAGCPRDLSDDAFPVGACARTVFGKAEIVLYHVKARVYRIEVWRSFSDYVVSYLEEAGAATR